MGSTPEGTYLYYLHSLWGSSNFYLNFNTFFLKLCKYKYQITVLFQNIVYQIKDDLKVFMVFLEI